MIIYLLTSILITKPFSTMCAKMTVTIVTIVTASTRCSPCTFSHEDSMFRIVVFVLVIWSRSFGQNQFRERGHCSLYININIYIIVADFDSLFSILTKMTMTTLTATRPRFFYGLKGPIGLAAKAALAPSLSL